jgi:hypothetical protein
MKNFNEKRSRIFSSFVAEHLKIVFRFKVIRADETIFWEMKAGHL